MAGSSSKEVIEQGHGPGWVWPVLVLALCHADAVASAQVLNILVDPIKASLAISDTRYSLLQGFALVIFAAVLGIPAARLADRGSRRRILLFAVAGWTLGSMACALAQSFGQLFAARMLVGLGEVLLFPSALAMIADLTPSQKLGRAVAVFGCGGPVGAAAALAGGGWLVAHPFLPGAAAGQSWRIAFMACALCGGLALALLLMVREPLRPARSDAATSFTEVGRLIWRERRLFLGVGVGLLALSLCVFATSAWAPALLVRVRGFSYAEAGAITGGASLACAVAGAWTVGWLSDRLDRSGRQDGVLIAGTAAALLIVCLMAGVLLAPGRPAAAVALAALYGLLGAPTVLGGAAIQQMTPQPVRAQVTAIYVLLINLISAGAGPAAVALLTDHVFGRASAVGLSLMIVDGAAGTAAIAAFSLSRRAFAAARRAVVN